MLHETLLLILVLGSGLMAAAETALAAAPRAAVRARAEQRRFGAASALRLVEDDERMAATLLFGAGLLALCAMGWAVLCWPPSWVGLVFGALGLAALTDLLPRLLAMVGPVHALCAVAPFVRRPALALAPVLGGLRVVLRGVLRLAGLNPDTESHRLALREEIAGAISLGHSEGAVEKESRDRLLGALDLSDRTVNEIMRHRRDCEMVDADLAPEELLHKVLASSHSRLPLYRDSDDNILGVIHAKDLVREVERLNQLHPTREEALAALDPVATAMKPYFIPDTTTLDEQMREFLKRRTHFALVVDEYGGLQGLITLEDILEEIVGEIRDEFDKVDSTARVKREADGAVQVDGAMTIRDLNRATDWQLPDDEAVTIAGLVIHEAQSIPEAGQVFAFHGFRFEVLARRENRLTRLRIRPL